MKETECDVKQRMGARANPGAKEVNPEEPKNETHFNELAVKRYKRPRDLECSDGRV